MKRFFVRWDALWPGIGVAVAALVINGLMWGSYANPVEGQLVGGPNQDRATVLIGVGLALAIGTLFTRSVLLRAAIAAAWVAAAVMSEPYVPGYSITATCAIIGVFSVLDSWPRSPKGEGRRWRERSLTIRSSLICLIVCGLLGELPIGWLLYPGLVICALPLLLGKLPEVPVLRKAFAPVPTAAEASTTEVGGAHAPEAPTAPAPSTTERRQQMLDELASRRDGHYGTARALGITCAVVIAIVASSAFFPFDIQTVIRNFFLILLIAVPCGIAALIAAAAGGETARKIAELENEADAAVDSGTASA